MIGAARLGGSDVGPDQAKPGRSDGFRYPVALICCRGGARVRLCPRGSTGEARRAWSGQDKNPAAVGQSDRQTPRIIPVNAQNPGHDGGAGLQPEVRTASGTRTIDGPCSAVVRSLTFPEGASLAGASVRLDAAVGSPSPLWGGGTREAGGWGWSHPPGAWAHPPPSCAKVLRT